MVSGVSSKDRWGIGDAMWIYPTARSDDTDSAGSSSGTGGDTSGAGGSSSTTGNGEELVNITNSEGIDLSKLLAPFMC